MKVLKKKLKLNKRIKFDVQVAKANLDRAILDLKATRLKPIQTRLKQSSKKVTSDADLAWVIAARVLDRVKGIRKSLAKSKTTPGKKRTVKRSQTARA